METNAKYLLIVGVEGWDQPITRDFADAAEALTAADAAASHPSCLRAEVFSTLADEAIYQTRFAA